MDGPRRAIRMLAATVLAALVACGGADPPDDAQPTLPRGTLTITTEAGEVAVDVEIAETTEQKMVGLMHRETLGEQSGMVFLEEDPARISFTMRNTLIPLSLAVWGPDRRIRSIIDMAPCRSEPCPSYDPGAAWVGALEVNRGFFDRHGVAVGDVVRLDR